METAAFGLLIFAVIPASIQISNMIETTYQASIDATIESAKETTSAVEGAASDETTEDEGFWEGLISSVTEGITNVTTGIADKVGGMINDFMEALAVMLVTSCVIPVLVLLSFIWFAKILLALDIPISYEGVRKGFKRTISREKNQKVNEKRKRVSVKKGPLRKNCPGLYCSKYNSGQLFIS